jgi:hypothetical protein
MWLASISVVASAQPVHVQPQGLRATKIEAPAFDVDPHLPPSRCAVRVEIDEGGLPVATEARACPPKFAAMAEAAVDEWRWAPPGVDGHALTWVAVEFTGRGRLPVAAAERCTYALRVTADGRVAPAGAVAPQCAIWPLKALHGSVPAAGACTVSIDAGILRDTPGWVVAEDCPEAAREIAAVIAGDSLFVEGTASTRLVIELPAVGSAPAASAIEVHGPELGELEAVGRIGNGPAGPSELDPSLVVPAGTTAPTVDFAELMRRKKAQAESEAPPDAEEDED